jgi:hypothetical protein
LRGSGWRRGLRCNPAREQGTYELSDDPTKHELISREAAQVVMTNHRPL